MLKSFGFKIVLLCLFLVPLIIGTTNVYGKAGPEPPSDAEHLEGPVIAGVLTMVDNGDGTVNTTFQGLCKSHPRVVKVKKRFCSFESFVAFNDIVSDDILELRLAGGGPEDCHSTCGGEDLIVTKVIKFTRPAENVIAATIELMFVVPNE